MGKKKFNKKNLNLTENNQINDINYEIKTQSYSFGNSIISYFFNFIKNPSFSLKETIANFSFGLLIILILLLTIILKTGEEQYINKGGSINNNVDYYKILNIHKTSSMADIRKSFRKLSLRWHPDKNPECDICVDKFRQLSKAYEILSDPDKKKAYDLNKGDIEVIPSEAVTLTKENFDDLISKSTTPWVIQVYTDTDNSCHHFSPIWEEAIIEMGSYYQFGRINANKNKDLISKLPLYVKVYPAVFVLTDNSMYEIYSNIFDPTYESFIDFLIKSYPKSLNTLSNINEINDWWKKTSSINNKPKILFTSGTRSSPTLLLRYFSLKWAPVFDFAFLSLDAINQISNSIGLKGNTPSIIALPYFDNNGLYDIINAEKPNIYYLDSIKGSDIPTVLSTMLFKIQQSHQPFLDSNSAPLLCKSNESSKVYCLIIIVDDDENQKCIQSISSILDISQSKYLDEQKNQLIDPIESDDYVLDNIYIQPVKLILKSKMKNIPNVSNKIKFNDMWNELDKSKLLLVDIESSRISKLSNVNDLYQKIQEEEIFWRQLPKYCSSIDGSLYKLCLPDSNMNKNILSTLLMQTKSTILIIFIGIFTIYIFSMLTTYQKLTLIFLIPIITAIFSYISISKIIGVNL